MYVVKYQHSLYIFSEAFNCVIILIYIVFRIVTLLYTANASLETLEQTHCLLQYKNRRRYSVCIFWPPCCCCWTCFVVLFEADGQWMLSGTVAQKCLTLKGSASQTCLTSDGGAKSAWRTTTVNIVHCSQGTGTSHFYIDNWEEQQEYVYHIEEGLN